MLEFRLSRSTLIIMWGFESTPDNKYFPAYYTTGMYVYMYVYHYYYLFICLFEDSFFDDFYSSGVNEERH